MQQNKNVDIYVFSGTGNTLLIANKIADVLNKKSFISKVHRMEAVVPAEIKLNSIIGIGFTVACWNTYPFVRKWIDNLPYAKGTEVFLFNSMGDSSLKMISHIAKILSKKGYKITGSKEFVMPNNFLLVENDNKKILKINRTMPKVEDFAKSIAENTCSQVKSTIISSAAFAVTTFITSLWKTKFSQKFIKFKIDKNKCTKCGICSEICPVSNITINDYPEFSMKCQFCLRCVSFCPTKAIKSRFLYKNRTHTGVSLGEIKWKESL
ncbi:MAG: EFR1 family ferrodoxin [Endomicrobiaceae bacterium]